MKRAAVINDLSGISRCSLTVAISVLSTLEVEVCPLPTAILSNQTEYDDFTFLDFTPHMSPFIENWKKIGYNFDAIYSGFLGSKQQIDIVIEFAKYFKEEKTIFVVDPVMGDGGELYSIYDYEYVKHMRKLIKYADVITPNLTEFSFLTGYNMEWGLDISKIKDYAYNLVEDSSCKKIIITGIKKEDNKIVNLSLDIETDDVFIKEVDYSGKSYSGTGDLFASIVTGYLVNGYKLEDAAEIASDFISKVARHTHNYDRDTREGIMYELYLKELRL